MKRLLFWAIALNLCVWSSALYGQDQGFTKVWDGGLGDAGTDPPNLIRGWGVIAGFDLDDDGNKEFASFDGDNKRIIVWESQAHASHDYAVVWHMDKGDTLNGGERSLMITDLDEDGNLELIQVWDSFHPDSAKGFNALEIYEHDPTSGDFLPAEPTHTYDPPRNSASLVRLEFQSQALDVDGDGTVEIILTHRGGKNIILSIISMTGKDFSAPAWVVEYVDSTTTTDSTRHGKKVHSMTVGDLDGNGKQDMLVQLDGNHQPIVVYSVTGADAYTHTLFDTLKYGTAYRGSAGKLAIADFDADGNNEVYIGARGGKVWVVSGITDIATAFNEANFFLIADLLTENIEKPELRGGIIGDADNNGSKDFYVTARDPLEAVYDFEWLGGAGGNVTDPDNYQMFKLYNDDNADAYTVGMVAIAIGDLDGDGPDHQDIVFTTGNGNPGEKPGIFIIEHDASVVRIASGAATIPGSFSLKQNYPNPFNPATSIVYELSAAGDVKLVIYNILGQEVRTLFSGHRSMGRHEALWDGKDHEGKSMMSGIYYYTLESSGFKETRKMLLLK